MSTLGFDNYVEPLKLYLQKYRESMKGDKQPGDGFEEITDVICKYIFLILLRFGVQPTEFCSCFCLAKHLSHRWKWKPSATDL